MVRAGAVFEDVDALPCPEREIAVIHGDGEAGIGEHGADVGSGVVGTLQIVRVPAVPFGNEAFHECRQICASGGVPILTDDQRGAGVLQEQIAHTFPHVPGFQLCADRGGDLVQPFAGRGNFESGLVPVHEPSNYTQDGRKRRCRPPNTKDDRRYNGG